MSSIGDLIIDSLSIYGSRCKYESGKKEVATKMSFLVVVKVIRPRDSPYKS